MGKNIRIALVYLNKERNIGRGVGYIASVLLNAGYNVTFFDTVYEHLDSVGTKIVASKYDIVFISASTLFYKDAVQLSKLIKHSSSVPIILGGTHATILREKILEECLDIDYICVGEGEDFVLEFLDKYGTETVFSTQNLGYRDPNGNIKINPVRECTNLDTLPKFRYDIFPERSVILSAPLPGFCYVFSTRGCPYNCSYCCNSYYLSLYKKGFLRKRSIHGIIEELNFLKSTYPAKIFYFGDEMILFDKEYCTELFSRVKREVGLPYGCMVRVESVNEDIVKLFKDTGCRYVGMGVECGDEKFRKEFLNRHMSNAQIVNAFQMLRQVPNIMLTSYNMRNYPVDYDNELTQQTLILNSIIRPDIIQMSVFFPFPGTKLYDYCVENDLIDYDKLNGTTDYFSQSVLKVRRPDVASEKDPKDSTRIFRW